MLRRALRPRNIAPADNAGATSPIQIMLVLSARLFSPTRTINGFAAQFCLPASVFQPGSLSSIRTASRPASSSNKLFDRCTHNAVTGPSWPSASRSVAIPTHASGRALALATRLSSLNRKNLSSLVGRQQLTGLPTDVCTRTCDDGDFANVHQRLFGTPLNPLPKCCGDLWMPDDFVNTFVSPSNIG